MESVINLEGFAAAARTFGQEGPFDHAIIDNFFTDDFARALEAEFPAFDGDAWHTYDNAIELKKTCNNWNLFPPCTYQVFNYLNSKAFTDLVSLHLLDGIPVHADPGLNGGGWHIHGAGGKLNTHLDYSIHPKLGLQRKLNIIIYMNSRWKPEWGGHLGLWSNERPERPGALIKSVEPRFNRAVVFDTTQNSWHGLPEPLTCPPDEQRKSLAAYFLCAAPADVDPRGKALFAPTEAQKSDEGVLELIRRRSNVETAASVYKRP